MMRIKSLAIGLLVMMPAVAASPQDWSASSVLGSGRWVKIAVTEEGIYRLDHSRLRDMGFADPGSAVL